MPKRTYIGIDNKAKRVKKMYVGVDDKARRVKKVYIGIGGKARPCFGTEPLYYGKIDDLSIGKPYGNYATTVGDYALFGGSTIDAYNKSLVHTVAEPPTVDRGPNVAATSVGDYAIFAGGYYNDSPVSTVDAYSSDLSKISVTPMRYTRYGATATTVGNYAIIDGGSAKYSTNDYNSEIYDTNLTKVTDCDNDKVFTHPHEYVSSTTVGDYAIFAGGRRQGYVTSSSLMYGYNKDLTRTGSLGWGIAMSSGRWAMLCTSVGDYAIFAGGHSFDTSQITYDTIDILNKDLVLLTPMTLPMARYAGAATTIDDYAIFAGGCYCNNTNSENNYTVMIDENLVLTNIVTPHYVEAGAATTVGGYAIFAGKGRTPNTADNATVSLGAVSTNVEVYTI